LGAALLNDGVDCEVICDGMHVCPEMLKIYFRVKDYDRFMMISDCSVYSGAPVGRYKGWDPTMVMNVTEEGFVLSDTGRLCGSSQPVLYGIGNLTEKLGIPLETVIRMASLNPARKYGFDKNKGSIAIGKDADFVVISDSCKAMYTYSNGIKVYDRVSDGTIFNPYFYPTMKL
jgi:N-acetylglucosamine-6-phosphate deacetylase